MSLFASFQFAGLEIGRADEFPGGNHIIPNPTFAVRLIAIHHGSAMCSKRRSMSESCQSNPYNVV